MYMEVTLLEMRNECNCKGVKIINIAKGYCKQLIFLYTINKLYIQEINYVNITYIE